MRQFTLIIFFFISLSGFTQDKIQEFNPIIGASLEFDSNVLNEFYEWTLLLDSLENGLVDYDKFSKEKKEFFERWDETYSSPYDAVGGGCSWYCGGGPYLITASSSLKSQGENHYEAKNAHDLNYKTAWIEGVEGYGIGEYLIYNFSPESPRINEIIVANGYVKTKSSWENNSRVKKMKVYINDEPFAILNLKDEQAIQSYKVPLLGRYSETLDWTLKFEILEVYKGKKYDDVAISEIYFDGIDVHCIARGTKVMLSNSSTKNIEDLKSGDSLLTYNSKNNKTLVSIVENIELAKHCGLVSYIFENNIKITATQDHPFLIVDKGWSSLLPEKSRLYKGYEDVKKIKIGDSFRFVGAKGEISSIKLTKIDYLKSEEVTYTISKLSHGDNFIANGFIVGVEELNK